MAHYYYYHYDRCCSYVGFLNFGRQGISLSKRCLKFPTIVHEIGHAVGFWHEHTRPDRDEYVDIFFDHIDNQYLKNFLKVHPSLVNSHGVGYDYNSIMHYDSDFFALVWGLDTLRAKDTSIPVGLAVALSPMDILQTNRLYANQCGKFTGLVQATPISQTHTLSGMPSLLLEATSTGHTPNLRVALYIMPVVVS